MNQSTTVMQAAGDQDCSAADYLRTIPLCFDCSGDADQTRRDSGIGVKNRINFAGKKNFISSFAPPYAVVNDTHFLSTLTNRDWVAGLLDSVKVALIKDRDYFDFLEKHADDLVQRNNQIRLAELSRLYAS